MGSSLQVLYRAGLSWSDNRSNTNAHKGNVVLFPWDEQRIGVGLVDFDACGERKEMSKNALRIFQRKESVSFADDLTSTSSMHSETQLRVNTRRISFSGINNTLEQGFWKGYRAKHPVAWVNRAVFDQYMGLLRLFADQSNSLSAEEVAAFNRMGLHY